MPAIPDLLLLRLDALELDIEKVRAAVDSAEKRSDLIRDAHRLLKPVNGELRAVETRLSSVVSALADDPEIGAALNVQNADLPAGLVGTPERLKSVIDSVGNAVKKLDDVIANTVRLENRTDDLRNGLNRRCNEMISSLNHLRDEVRTTSANNRATQWKTYQRLLDDVGRPLFAEYVDFLGGLTVRDTGLDDQVCEMTDSLLRRFVSLTRRSLPLPARQAALGSALDSVVLLGFPEWSIWGIPLVGHEVGLAYARDLNTNLLDAIKQYVVEPQPVPATSPTTTVDDGSSDQDETAAGRTEQYVTELVADVFATYTLGLAYACAALLLRLSPRHDEPYDRHRPRDIERARVIMLTLKIGPAGAAAGGSYSDEVGKLQSIWEEAVRAHAEPHEAVEALAEAKGPPPGEDWLDDLTKEMVENFEGLMTIKRFDAARWAASGPWQEALGEKAAGPGWSNDESVLDVLTAAWRLRMQPDTDRNQLATDIKTRWATSKRGI